MEQFCSKNIWRLETELLPLYCSFKSDKVLESYKTQPVYNIIELTLN